MIVREDVQEIRRGIIAAIVFSLLTWMLSKLFGMEIPSANRDAVMMVIGALLLRMNDIVGYDFNSSASSAKKDHIIAAQAETAKTIASSVAATNDPTTMSIGKGEQATATPTEEGAVITKEPAP